MKKTLLAGLAIGMMMLGMAGMASATTITYGGTPLDGIQTSSKVGAQVETFNGVSSTPVSVASATGLDQPWTWSGSALVEPAGTNIPGDTAAPAGDLSQFLSVPNPLSSGFVTAFLGGGLYNYFGLFWGSVDAYNTITFLNGVNVTESFTGQDVLTPNVANGNQVAPETNLYVNFNDLNPFDSFRLTSTNFAFELDNAAVAPVPEPATMFLLGTGLVGLVGARRKKKA